MCDFEDGPVAIVEPQGDIEPITLEPVDSVSITILVDNVCDMLLSNRGPAHRFDWIPSRGTVFTDGASLDCPRAEHGFSAMVTLDAKHRLLFDAGVSPTGLVENMARLELASDTLEAVVLSHGHWDHVGGLEGLAQRLGRRRLPLVLHPDGWNRRRVVIEGVEPFELPTPSRSALLAAGFDIIERPGPSLLFRRSLLVTGEVPRTTSFEIGMRRQQAWLQSSWVPDPLVRDDQAIIVYLRGKGLIVLTGCGHAGIVNILRHARRITGIEQVHAVVGGFHLNGPVFSPIIPQVCDALAELSPSWIVAGHCTGPEALRALGTRFPDAWLPNSVGSRYDF